MIIKECQLLAQSDDSNESRNGRATTLADPLRHGEGGISASLSSGLLPTERVLLCKTPEGRRGAYMSARPGSIYGERVTPSLLLPVPVESFLMHQFTLVQLALLIGTLPQHQCGSSSKTH
jgi:hypothetical protein